MMKEIHFTIEDCIRYFERKLSPQETLALFTHTETCASCAKIYDFACAQQRTPASLKFNFSLSESDSHGHLEREELIAYSEGVIEKEDLELLEQHAMDCSRCKKALESFVTQKQASKSRIKKNNRVKTWFTGLREQITATASLFANQRKNLAYAGSLFCLLIVGGLVIVSFWRGGALKRISEFTSNNRINIEVIKAAPPSKLPSNNERTTSDNASKIYGANGRQDKVTVKDEKPLLSARNSKTIEQLVIKDQDGVEILIRSNKIMGAENASPVLREEMVAALNGKDIFPRPFYTSDDLSMIKTRGSRLEGDRNLMRLISPVNKTVRDCTPTFEWERVADEKGLDVEYQVSIVDEEFNLVAQSPFLKVAQWKINIPLSRGKKYAWQVKTYLGGSELASTTPDKGASFSVISESEDIKITESEKTLNSHLALGVLYLKAGLLDEAEKEIWALQQLNPKSKEVKRLLNQICKRRNPKDAKLRCMLGQSN